MSGSNKKAKKLPISRATIDKLEKKLAAAVRKNDTLEYKLEGAQETIDNQASELQNLKKHTEAARNLLELKDEAYQQTVERNGELVEQLEQLQAEYHEATTDSLDLAGISKGLSLAVSTMTETLLERAMPSKITHKVSLRSKEE